MRRFGLAALITLTFVAAAVPPARFSLWGVALGRPIDGSAVEIDRCQTGREFAFRGGRYRITTDDYLIGVHHEHHDTVAVLTALERVHACLVSSRTRHFEAILTLRDSLVIDANFFWPDSARRPTMAAILAELTTSLGPPLTGEHLGQVWAKEGAGVYVNPRGPFADGPSVAMTDRAACEWFERLVHSAGPQQERAAKHCWEV
jgi:hypothetical protein